VTWDLFGGTISLVPSIAVDPAGPLLYRLTPDAPELVWTNYIQDGVLPNIDAVIVARDYTHVALPWVSLICGVLVIAVTVVAWRRKQPALIAIAVAATVVAAVTWTTVRVDVPRLVARASGISSEAGALVVEALLQNVYRAFEFRADEVVYDKLALSVDGRLLEDVFLIQRRMMGERGTNGPDVNVKELTLNEALTEPLDDGRLGFVADTRWSVIGSVSHWGHTHVRQNDYHALLEIEADRGAWKLVALDIIDETRADLTQPFSATTAP
jgi:hypothetical protein